MKTPFELFGKETPKGWDSFIDPLIEKAAALGVRVDQVKEKFGGLRFYHDYSNKEFTKEVEEAEHKSYITCHICGAPGKLCGGGWIMPFCETHAKEAGRVWRDIA